jgi:glutamate-1-semialdehyde aminotransferase
MDEPVYEKIDRLGQNLRTRLSETFSRSTLGVRVTGVGSLFGIHFTREKFIRDTRHLSGQYKEQAKQMFSHLLNNGILLLSTDLPHGAISYSHSENEIDTLVFGIQDYLQRQAH